VLLNNYSTLSPNLIDFLSKIFKPNKPDIEAIFYKYNIKRNLNKFETYEVDIIINGRQAEDSIEYVGIGIGYCDYSDLNKRHTINIIMAQ